MEQQAPAEATVQNRIVIEVLSDGNLKWKLTNAEGEALNASALVGFIHQHCVRVAEHTLIDMIAIKTSQTLIKVTEAVQGAQRIVGPNGMPQGGGPINLGPRI